MLVKEKAKDSSAEPKVTLPSNGLIKFENPSSEDCMEEIIVLMFSI